MSGAKSPSEADSPHARGESFERKPVAFASALTRRSRQRSVPRSHVSSYAH